METLNPKRNFFEKPSLGSVIIILAGFALVIGFGRYRERQISAKREAAQFAQAQADKQAYLDGVEQGAKDMLRLGASESQVIDTTVSTFRQKGATDSEIDALKKRLSVLARERK